MRESYGTVSCYLDLPLTRWRNKRDVGQPIPRLRRKLLLSCSNRRNQVRVTNKSTADAARSAAEQAPRRGMKTTLSSMPTRSASRFALALRLLASPPPRRNSCGSPLHRGSDPRDIGRNPLKYRW